MKGIVPALSSTLLIILLIIIFSVVIIPASASPKENNGLTGGQTSLKPLSPPGTFVPGGPGYLMIPAADFNPGQDGTLFTSGASIITRAGSPHNDYIAPVFLPNGVTISKLVFYFTDIDTSQFTQLFLYRSPLPGASVTEMASVTSPFSSATGATYREDTTIQNPIVNNQDYEYFLILQLPAAVPNTTLSVGGARIDYGFPVSLPLVNK